MEENCSGGELPGDDGTIASGSRGKLPVSDSIIGNASGGELPGDDGTIGSESPYITQEEHEAILAAKNMTQEEFDASDEDKNKEEQAPKKRGRRNKWSIAPISHAKKCWVLPKKMRNKGNKGKEEKMESISQFIQREFYPGENGGKDFIKDLRETKQMFEDVLNDPTIPDLESDDSEIDWDRYYKSVTEELEKDEDFKPFCRKPETDGFEEFRLQRKRHLMEIRKKKNENIARAEGRKGPSNKSNAVKSVDTKLKCEAAASSESNVKKSGVRQLKPVKIVPKKKSAKDSDDFECKPKKSQHENNELGIATRPKRAYRSKAPVKFNFGDESNDES